MARASLSLRSHAQRSPAPAVTPRQYSRRHACAACVAGAGIGSVMAFIAVAIITQSPYAFLPALMDAVTPRSISSGQSVTGRYVASLAREAIEHKAQPAPVVAPAASQQAAVMIASPSPAAAAAPDLATSLLNDLAHIFTAGVDRTPNTAPLPDYLVDTAVITLATGDEAARNAVALFQSLEDVGSRIPTRIVLLARGGQGSADCQNDEWRRKRGRFEVSCGSLDTVAEEIISQVYLDTLAKLHVTPVVIDPIPDTPYTVIPGGRQIFWGMAFNKLHIFGMKQYKKILWMDADTLVFQNVDELLQAPMFTSAFTYDCCNQNSPARPSGGLWVVQPSDEIMQKLLKLIAGPVPGTESDVWHWGDMQVVRYLFGRPHNISDPEPYFPSVIDHRHGYVPGLKYYPFVKALSPDKLQTYINERVPKDRQVEGFMEAKYGNEAEPMWRMLDTRYDQCVGHCECMPDRDMPETFLTVHFSCIQHIAKPSKYESEHAFMSALYKYAASCTRFYFLVWYEKFKRTHGRLPAPLWDGPLVPVYDAAHDEVVRANRLRDQV